MTNSALCRLRPRVTDMMNGTFRPEVVIDDGARGDIKLGAPVATIEEANRLAAAACEGSPGAWAGEWFAVA